MASAAAEEKTAEELRKEIVELHRQQREITERLRDPRGLRRAGVTPAGPGHDGGARFRGFVRPAAESEDQPAPKKRLLSAVIKLEDGEIKPEVDGADPAKVQVSASDARPNLVGEINNTRSVNPMNNGGLRRDINPRMRKMDFDFPPAEPVPRVLPKNEDPSLIKRNRRMLGQLLGTLEKFQEEDQKLSTSEAYMKRTDSLRRAEQKARDESERLRQQEREQIAEKRRRDLTLRARVAAKAEEKKLELLFITWSEHHKKLSNFLRTKAEPAIYYMPTRPLSGDASVIEQRKEQTFVEWKSTRRAELSEYQRQIGEQYVANAEAELLRWQNTRNARRANLVNNATTNLQETMDKELETHKLEHGPKTRRIQGSNDEDEDVEDIIIEDELLDEVLDAQEKIDGHDATKPMEAGNGSPQP